MYGKIVSALICCAAVFMCAGCAKPAAYIASRGETYAFGEVVPVARDGQGASGGESTSQNDGNGATGGKAAADTVYWTSGGKVYHIDPACGSLARSKEVLEGSVEESGRQRACAFCDAEE